MAKLHHLARVTTPTTGTGTITLGPTVAGYLSFANAGIRDGDGISYTLVDGSQTEIGRGVYRSTGPTLSRMVLQSSNNNNPLNLSGNAEVYVSEVLGGGDMLKAIYDVNNNGIVDAAESVPWTGVTDLPIRTLFSETVVTGYSTYSAFVLCTNLGRLTHVRFRIDGTSNSTELTFTLPINDLSAGFVPYLPCMVIDNGVGQELPGCVIMDHGTNLVRAGKRLNAVGGFTASGRKFITGDFWVYSG